MAVNRWGQARREVTALTPLIVQKLESGSTVRQIWLELRSEGRITTALANFYIHVGKLSQPQPNETKLTTGSSGGGLVSLLPPRSVTVSPPPAKSSSSDDLNRAFDHNNRPCEGDLW